MQKCCDQFADMWLVDISTLVSIDEYKGPEEMARGRLVRQRQGATRRLVLAGMTEWRASIQGSLVVIDRPGPMKRRVRKNTKPPKPIIQTNFTA